MEIEGIEKIGAITAELMDQLELDEHPNGIGACRVSTVGLVVEIRAENEDPDGNDFTRIVYRCSDTRQWIQAGLFLVASDDARRWGEDVGEED